jgi:hypothetical protein
MYQEDEPRTRRERILDAFHLSPIRATCPTHHIIFGLITLLISGEECNAWSTKLCNFLQVSVTFPSYVQISSSELCSRTPSKWQTKVSHPHKTTGKIMVTYTKLSVFLVTKPEDRKILRLMVAGTPWIECALHFFTRALLTCQCLSQIWTLDTLSKDFLAVFMLWSCSASCWWDMKIHSFLILPHYLLISLCKLSLREAPISGLRNLIFTLLGFPRHSFLVSTFTIQT